MFGNKKKKKAVLDEKFNKVYADIRAIDDWDNPKKIEHYILDSCEQIIASTKDIEAQKAQYRVLSNYLLDIKKIANMPVDKRKELHQVAKQITSLTTSKINYQKEPHKITEEQFVLMEENEEAIPSTIYRMQENERYQATVKREMNILEGEKGELEVERDEWNRSNRLLKSISILFLFTFVSLLIFLMILKMAVTFDITFFVLGLLFIGAVLGMLIFMKANSLSRQNHRITKEKNRKISLLNIVRMKYANVTRAIEYEKKRYQVQNSYELNYFWEAYLETVRQKEQYMQDNDDLEYFTGRLMRILGNIELYDRKIWLSQIAALVHKEDMKEVHDNLLQRQTEIRERITENTASVKSERDEIDRLMREHNYYVPEILEIITSVDRLCGLK